MPADPKTACPVCGRPAEPGSRPFCSPRCRSVDLGRWLGGTYAIPGTPARDDDEEAES
jgi:hypothetical protein